MTRRRWLAAPLLAALLLSTQAAPPSEHVHAQASFVQPFDGAPSAPQPWRPTDWDIQIHQNAANEWRKFEPTIGQHGPDCSAPPATHPVTTHEDAVFLCNDHMMTSIYSGYGVIYLTPNQLLDFSGGEAVLRFDMSTLRASTRDWVDVWISPFDENLALPLDEPTDLNGPPRRSVHVGMQLSPSGTYMKTGIIRDFQGQFVNPSSERGYETAFVPSTTRRDTFEIRVSRTHVKVGMPQYNLWWVDAPIADLGWSQGVVQLGHHTYNPGKGCVGEPEPCPNTWHWDNVQMSPSVPFTMLKADRRYADRTTPSVGFSAPAPDGAHLRFGGFGKSLEVSFDGGATWQPAQAQAEEALSPPKFHSFWTPIPAGAMRAQFRGQYIDTIDWMARDISIWAPGVGVVDVPSPTPTMTLTPTVTATSTAVPATVTPTQTPVPSSCEVRVRVSGIEAWLPRPSAFCDGN